MPIVMIRVTVIFIVVVERMLTSIIIIIIMVRAVVLVLGFGLRLQVLACIAEIEHLIT